MKMKLRKNPKRSVKALTSGPGKRNEGGTTTTNTSPGRGRPASAAAKAVRQAFPGIRSGRRSGRKASASKTKAGASHSSEDDEGAELPQEEEATQVIIMEGEDDDETEGTGQQSKADETETDKKSAESSMSVDDAEGDISQNEDKDVEVSENAGNASGEKGSSEAAVEDSTKQDAPRPKRAAAILQRKTSEDGVTQRRSSRQLAKAKQIEDQSDSKGAVDKDKDDRSFERFYARVKETSVVSERWSFGGVLWDPTKKMKVMAASEVDVTSGGNMRLRRCVQVFEDMSVRVMVEGADMTSTFSPSGVVKSVNEVAQLIHKVATSKICAGIKNFGSTDKVYFPHCILRGESYFAPECPIVIDYGVVGPLCAHCNRLRNMIHRRNTKETNLLYSKFSRDPVKNIRSGFGKQLYSMLTDMIEASSVDAKKERKKLRRMIPANAKEYPFRGTADGGIDENQLQLQQHQIQLQLQQQLQLQHQQQLQKFIQSDSSGNITISSLSGGNTIMTPSSSSEYIRLAKPYGGQSEMMAFNVVSSSGQRSSFKVSREGGQTTTATTIGGTVLTPGEMHMVEQLVLQEGHDVGNVIIQNSGDFTLAEGQEYELIGEADPNNPIQVLEVLKEQNESNNTIEIIEVDDQTLAQLTSQNLGNFIIQEPGGDFEVQEIDANDPNFRHLVKALNPSNVVYQT